MHTFRSAQLEEWVPRKGVLCHFGTPLSDVNQRWDVFAVCMSFLYVAVVEHRD